MVLKNLFIYLFQKFLYFLKTIPNGKFTGSDNGHEDFMKNLKKF